MILLGLGGSITYGTNIETSDIDVRGIAMNRKSDLIGFTEFEQYTDTIIPLFMNCNPNTIELLGLKPEHYLYLSDIGQMLLDNRSGFLLKKSNSVL